MRPIPMLLLVSACAAPALDLPASPEIARAAYPTLVPFDQILDQRVDTSGVSPEATAALRTRADRAAARELGEVETGPLAARAARLRNRANDLGSANDTAQADGEDTALDARLRALRARIDDG